MIQQLIYRGTIEGYRVVAISEGLAGRGLSKKLQSLSRMPANWVGSSPIFCRTGIEDGMVVMRTAVDPNGTRNHHISHILYIPAEDIAAFSKAIVPAGFFQKTYKDVRLTDTLPMIQPTEFACDLLAESASDDFAQLFAGQAELLAYLISIIPMYAIPVQNRKYKGVCVITPDSSEKMSESAYRIMETLIRLYPGLWESNIGYRTFWTNPENNAQFPIFFSNNQWMSRYDQVLNAGYVVINIGTGKCEYTKGQIPQPALPVEQLAMALIAGKSQDVLGAIDIIRENQDGARRAAEEAARLEAKRRAEEAAARLEAKRRAEEAARAEAQRKAEEAARIEAQRKAEEAARIEAQRKAEEAARLEAKRRAEEAARIEAQRKAEEAARIEAQRKAEEAARLEAKRRAEEAARIEAQRKAEEAARIKAKQSEKKTANQQTGQKTTESSGPEGKSGTRVLISRRQSPAKTGTMREDPHNLGHKLINKLLSLIESGGYPQEVDKRLEEVFNALKRMNDMNFFLMYMDAFFEDSSNYLTTQPRRSSLGFQNDALIHCAVEMANRSWHWMFHRTTLMSEPQSRFDAARNCFASIGRICTVKTNNPTLQRNLIEWRIACSVFNYEPCRLPKRIENCVNNINLMGEMSCSAFRKDLLILATDCFRYMDDPDARISRCGLSALLYACVYARPDKLMFDNKRSLYAMEEIRNRSVKKTMEERLNRIKVMVDKKWY